MIVYRTTHAVPYLMRGSSIRTRARTHRVSESRTQQKQEQHNDYWQQQQHAATAAAWQRGRPATSERASYRPFDDSVPGGCALFGSVTCARCYLSAVLSLVLCVVCWLFLAMIRTYVVMYVVREWITMLSGCVLLQVFCLY